jgi:hypothetical protein
MERQQQTVWEKKKPDHFPNVQVRRNLLLANISSVSHPMDGDPHAKYGLLTWDAAAGWQVELVRESSRERKR